MTKPEIIAHKCVHKIVAECHPILSVADQGPSSKGFQGVANPGQLLEPATDAANRNLLLHTKFDHEHTGKIFNVASTLQFFLRVVFLQSNLSTATQPTIARIIRRCATSIFLKWDLVKCKDARPNSRVGEMIASE